MNRLRGRRPTASMLRPSDRKLVTFYITPAAHYLVRIVAQSKGQTMGSLIEEMIAAEATRHGIDAGIAS